MNISERGLELIKRFEGYGRRLPDGSCTAYQERINGKLDIPTIGYGCTKGVKMGDVWSEALATERLMQEIEGHEARVLRFCTVELNQHQFDALVSFDYNTGGLMLKGNKPSGVLKAVNAGKFDEAVTELRRWNKFNGKPAKGLTSRRNAEIALFTEPVEEVAPDYMPQETDRPGLTTGEKFGIAAGGSTGIVGLNLLADPAGTMSTAVALKSNAGQLLAGVDLVTWGVPVVIGLAVIAFLVWSRRP